MHRISSRFRHVFAFTIILIAGVLLFVSVGAAQGSGRQSFDGVWEWIPESGIPAGGEREIVPDRYLTVSLDMARLQARLAVAPRVRTGADGIILTLPMPDGSFARFEVWDAPIMAPELAAKFPRIQTYAGQGIDDPTATVRFDTTPHGFHAMIISVQGTTYIDPYSRGDVTHYVVYDKRDYSARQPYEEILPLPDADADGEAIGAAGSDAIAAHGAQLRIYRTAVAATGEYTQYHGGTVEDGMAAIVTAINRVSGIYEREVSENMELVPNNDQIVYTDPDTDPYTNSSGSAMLDQNQSNLDSVIGSANYDLGHVFSTGGGGIASLGVVCKSGSKAKGVTGLPNPIGDPFYVDYVAHEMGHQHGGNHTFAGTAGSCFGNFNPTTTFEPGSGSTIMAYAGICGDHDIQDHSDDYFHVASLQEIINYITVDAGSTCGTVTATGNTPPTADAGTGGFTLPASTPFRLTGLATDPDADSLTYDWEEYDLGDGPFNTSAPNSGHPPFFRSFDPASGPTRTFPQMSDIIDNTETIGEQLPADSRTLHFRLTVRDNRAGGGGTDWDEISIDIDGGSGPFKVTAPNTAVTWSAGATETVTWDVAGTSNSPVSCANVDILLSTDGGWTYPTEVLLDTPNDGSEPITVPNVATAEARIQVQCADDRFFDISDADFSIEAVASTPTDLKITANGTTAELSWTHLGANTHYEVWRDVSPYFDPAQGEGTLVDTVEAVAGTNTFPDADRIGDPAVNYFWVVRGKVGSSVSAPTAPVGEFDYSLTAGTS
ncbi:MAG TPA: hypothetical protein G4N94_10840 [Caldilineae bacterium]|nr:hypothetical protein [Caldilineae bacterium]